jgi:hypothetical protein
VLDRKDEFFDVIERVGGTRPARCVFQKKVIENATIDKLEELSKLNLKTI